MNGYDAGTGMMEKVTAGATAALEHRDGWIFC